MQNIITKNKPDYSLLFLVLGLVSFGLLMINSASMVISESKFGSTYYYVNHQIINGLLIGIVGLVALSVTNYKILKKVALWAFIANIGLMAAVFIPGLGYAAGGAHRWIKIGGFTFQPSEILKLSAVVYFAAWLESRGRKIKDPKEGLVPFVFLAGLTGSFLIFQPDVGTLGVICFGLLAMFFAAGAKIKHIGLIVAVGIIGIVSLVWISPYRFQRFTTFLDPEADPLQSGYQISQSLIGIGAGGVTGLGFGYSRQKFNYLPEPVGDSIFAIVAEELGFIGATVLIVLYGFFMWRILKIAKNAPDDFGRYLAVGICSFWGIQAMINIAAISGAIPLTGIPLPFISYGGTALFIVLWSVGIVLNISRQSKKY
jgi:cell division protein FtsW